MANINALVASKLKPHETAERLAAFKEVLKEWYLTPRFVISMFAKRIDRSTHSARDWVNKNKEAKQLLDQCRKDDDKYRPYQEHQKYDKREHPDLIIALGRQGKYIAQLADLLGMPPASIREWRREHPEFDEACTIAYNAGYVYWLEYPKTFLDKKNNTGDIKLWEYMLARKFNYGRTFRSKLVTTKKQTGVEMMQEALEIHWDGCADLEDTLKTLELIDRKLDREDKEKGETAPEIANRDKVSEIIGTIKDFVQSKQ